MCSGNGVRYCCPEPGNFELSAEDDDANIIVDGRFGYEDCVGVEGACIDLDTTDCDGAVVLSGKCSGGGNIKCCPSPGEPSMGWAKDTDDFSEFDPDDPTGQMTYPWKDSGIPGCRGYGDTHNSGPTGDCFDPCKLNDGRDGTCYDNRVYDCDGSTGVANTCAGGKLRTCCPRPGSIKDKVWDSTANVGDDVWDDGGLSEFRFEGCEKGQDGSCLDTTQWRCNGAELMTGFCEGDATIRCCPEPGRPFATLGGGSGSSTGTPSSSGPGSDAGGAPPLSQGVCEGGAGYCYDSSRVQCKGAGALVGFCPEGDANVKCCPSEGNLVELPADAAIGAYASCLDGQAGTCIDTRTHECDGGVTMVGVCNGDGAIRCCTAPGTPTKIGDGTVQFKQHTVVVQCRTDSSMAIGGTYQRADGNLGVAPMAAVSMPSRSDPAAWQTLGSVGCHMSRTSLQDGWTACVCEEGVCAGDACFDQDDISYWQQGTCTNCVCDTSATSILEESEGGVDNGWVAAVVVILLLAAVLFGVAIWLRQRDGGGSGSLPNMWQQETIAMTHVNLGGDRRHQYAANADFEGGVQMNPVRIVANEVWTVAAPALPASAKAAAPATTVAYAIPFENPDARTAEYTFSSGGKVYSVPSEITVSGSDQQLYAVPSDLQLQTRAAWRKSSSAV